MGVGDGRTIVADADAALAAAGDASEVMIIGGKGLKCRRIGDGSQLTRLIHDGV